MNDLLRNACHVKCFGYRELCLLSVSFISKCG